MAKPWKMSDGPKSPNDVRVSSCLPRQQADKQLADQAAVLKATGRTEQFGGYVAKYGKGHAVFLRNRETD